MDIKPALLLIPTLIVVNINNFLGSIALILNIFYLSYQIYTHYKNNKY